MFKYETNFKLRIKLTELPICLCFLLTPQAGVNTRWWSDLTESFPQTEGSALTALLFGREGKNVANDRKRLIDGILSVQFVTITPVSFSDFYQLASCKFERQVSSPPTKQ